VKDSSKVHEFTLEQGYNPSEVVEAIKALKLDRKQWVDEVRTKSEAAKKKLANSVSQKSETRRAAYHPEGMLFREIYQAFNEHHSDGTVYVNEGASSMDSSRVWLDVKQPKCKLDAGATGAMGIGAPFAIGAATWSK